jgi:excisionase family DNA binding protein
MTLSLESHTARPHGAASTPTPAHEGPRLLTPGALWKRYGVPRDLIYTAIHDGSLKAYEMGSPRKSRFMVSPEDFEAWLETRRVGGK